MARVIIFSDLDGTLLDEATYSSALSAPAVQNLQAFGATIVICSSKTQSEQEAIRAMLGLQGPLIVENGSAIVVPANTLDIPEGIEKKNGTKILVLGKARGEILRLLSQVRINTGLAFEGFHDLSVDQISYVTGLNWEDAKRAQAREYSETIVTKFNQKQLKLFLQACNRYELQCLSGGRFLNVVGKGIHKGRAVSLLIKYFKSQFGSVVTIGVGDSKNDEAMLQVVDHSFLVQRPNGNWEALQVEGLNLIPAIGPLGFTSVANIIRRQWLLNMPE